MKAELTPLARAIVAELKARPQQFHELADAHRDVAWPQFLRAWGELRRAGILGRDDDGNYRIA
jgi:DNA-binding transcriptional ArsR family regulator